MVDQHLQQIDQPLIEKDVASVHGIDQGVVPLIESIVQIGAQRDQGLDFLRIARRQGLRKSSSAWLMWPQVAVVVCHVVTLTCGGDIRRRFALRLVAQLSGIRCGQ
ncbi:hypothetical protein ASC87_26855 [Rhizobacter sp. Root1221]|nr:hypothetical protein ASC87_26855 [Rhizobacter sp. Root1221]